MPEIRPLRLPDLEHLRLRRHFRLEIEDIRQLLETNPDSSFWIPDTDEVILVGNWRNRSDLHAIHGLAAGRNESALIELAIEQARRSSVAAVMMVDADELRSSSFYARHGFTIIDRIATYELPASRLGPEDTARQGTDITFSRVVAEDREARHEVEQLDHLAFPWFWWNVGAEFDAYLALPNVEVWIGALDGRVVSYIGITHYRGWGHLDRIATHPEVQRAGIGAATLELAIRLLRVHGAKRIALSTQGENVPAQRMYERRGFLRTHSHDYTVRGHILDEASLAPSAIRTGNASRGANPRPERNR
jgi:ribosomal protein S18 acetylase RimI-like enzyme